MSSFCLLFLLVGFCSFISFLPCSFNGKSYLLNFSTIVHLRFCWYQTVSKFVEISQQLLYRHLCYIWCKRNWVEDFEVLGDDGSTIGVTCASYFSPQNIFKYSVIAIFVWYPCNCSFSPWVLAFRKYWSSKSFVATECDRLCKWGCQTPDSMWVELPALGLHGSKWYPRVYLHLKYPR